MRLVVVSIFLIASSLLSTMATSQPSLSSKLEQISSLLQNTYSDDKPGAAVVILQGDNPVFIQGYGLANVEHKTNITASTPIGLGSVTKQFTAAAILLLVQDGLITLDQPVTSYLYDFPQSFSKVTIRQLLTHTSGLPDFFSNPDWYAKVNNPITPLAMIGLMAKTPITAEPGTAWNYSNFNYMVLAAVIEKVSGISYGQFVKERIFKPLSMTNSYLDEYTRIIPGRATGYEFHQGKLLKAHYMNPSHFSAAGALMSSADDLAKWHKALRTGNLLKRQFVKAAFTATTLENGSETGYGFGWNIEQFLGEKIIWHSGSGIGYETTTIQIPDLDDLYIAVLNNSPFIANSTNIARRLTAIMMDKPIPDFNETSMDEKMVLVLEGTYQFESGKEIQIRRVENILQYRLGKGSWKQILYGGQNLFFRKNSLIHFIANRNQSNQIDGISFVHGNQKSEFANKASSQVERPPKAIAFNDSIVKELAGHYDLGAGNLIRVAWSENQLTLQIGPQNPISLKASGNYEYFSAVDDVKVRFEKSGGTETKIFVDEIYSYSAQKIE